MLSLPPPHEWDVLWLRRLASLDCEQYRYYTTTLCRDVWLLHQQAIGAPPPERSSAAARLQLVSSRMRTQCGLGGEPPRGQAVCVALMWHADTYCLSPQADIYCVCCVCPASPQLLQNGRAVHSFMALNSPAIVLGNAMRSMKTGESGGPCAEWW